MKILSSFMALSINGADRISYTYDTINDEGELIEANKKGNFFVVSAELKSHINAIREYITENKLEG